MGIIALKHAFELTLFGIIERKGEETLSRHRARQRFGLVGAVKAKLAVAGAALSADALVPQDAQGELTLLLPIRAPAHPEPQSTSRLEPDAPGLIYL